MFGQGTLYIDLPHGRKYDAAYNCTPGILLFSETLDLDANVLVYTDAEFDHNGVQRRIPMGSDQYYPGTCEAVGRQCCVS